MAPPEPTAYRPCAGIMLLNDADEIFVAQRLDRTSDAWQMPQGGIDAGETPLVAAKREMLEEIGTDKAELIAEAAQTYRYDLPPELLGKIWDGKYRGQKQHWFLMRYTGTDADINLQTAEPEFSAYQWVAPSEIVSIIVPFKRDLYRALLAEFASYLS